MVIHINEQGTVDDAHVVRGVGHGLDEKALEATRAYRFSPAMRDGQPVACELYVEVNFNIYRKR